MTDVERKALVEILRASIVNKVPNYIDDAADQIEADAATIATLRARVEALEGALRELLHAACHETGFAAAVREDSGHAYPWEPLDVAEAKARALLMTGLIHKEDLK